MRRFLARRLLNIIEDCTGIGTVYSDFQAQEIEGGNKMRPNKRYEAFTLMELVIVIAIISALAGMILAGVFKAVERSRSAGTVTLFKNIDLACRTYFIDWGKYPPDGNTGSTPDANGANNVLYMALIAEVALSGAPAWGPYMEFDTRVLNGSEPELIIDYWRIPIVYDNNWTEGTDYKLAATPGDGEFDSAETDNNSKVDLLSAGPDKILGTADDVNNWED